jgi:AcrR family transcriptional regulator
MPFPKKIAEAGILSGALELVRRGGIQALSMRTLAAKLGVQASSLYRHFPNRSGLEGALSGLAANQLEQQMRKRSAGKAPAEACRAVGREYVDFAKAEPALFELLMAAPYDSSAGSPGKDLWNFILETVAAVTKIPDDTEAAVVLWSFLHGFAMLEKTGRFGASGPRAALDTGINAILQGLTDSKRQVKRPRKKAAR